MTADFSRNTFDPRKHYSDVLLQQGRVQLDADWNEQQSINAHRRERLGIDVVGPSGAPQDDPGFGLALTADGSDLTITSGRYYVDGIACDAVGARRRNGTTVGQERFPLRKWSRRTHTRDRLRGRRKPGRIQCGRD